jgi:N-acetylmuramoyl-L-alanine amidase
MKNQYENVIFSAGHGGSDVGAVAEDGTFESEINLAVTDKAFEILKKQSFEKALYVGRDIPSGETAKEVEKIAKREGWTHKDTILVDIHCDWRGATEGVMAYHYPNDQESIRLATTLCEEVSKVGNRKFKKIIPDTKHRDGSLAMIRAKWVLSCVLEIGSLRADENINDGLELLKSEEGQNQIAEAIVKGICKFAGVEYVSKELVTITAKEEAQIRSIISSLQAGWHGGLSKEGQELAHRHANEWREYLNT